MGQNLSSRLRSTATRTWGRAQAEAERLRKRFRGKVRGQVASMSAALGDWFDRTFPIIRKLVVIVLLLSALSAVHFFGFVSNLPPSIQRLVATSFAPKFSALFLYYGALALLGARFGTYIAAAMGVSVQGWWTGRLAGKSTLGMRRYLRNAKKEFSILEWPIFVIAPGLLAFIYSDLEETLFALSAITGIFVLLAPIAIPQAALAPIRFLKRLCRKHHSIRRLRNNINLIVTLAVALFAMSYLLGQARYTRLASECPIFIQSDAYIGTGIILARTDDATLVLEHDPSRSHKRYIVVNDKFLASDTDPPGSELFESLAKKDQSSPPKAISSAASAIPLKAVACPS